MTRRPPRRTVSPPAAAPVPPGESDEAPARPPGPPGPCRPPRPRGAWRSLLLGACLAAGLPGAVAPAAAAPEPSATSPATARPRSATPSATPPTGQPPARPARARARAAQAEGADAATAPRAGARGGAGPRAGAGARAGARTGLGPPGAAVAGAAARRGQAAVARPPAAADPERTEPPGTPAPPLDAAVQPRSAQLDLVVDPAQPRLRGTLGLELVLGQPTQSLTLHAAASVQVTSAYLESGAHRIAAQVQPADGEHLVLRLARPVPAGPVRLTVVFSSLGRDRDTDGLVRVLRGGDAYAASRFEPAAARRVFPLPDEPGWRLPWTLTLTVPAGLQARANTPVQQQEPAEEPGWQQWRFAPTPPLPGQALAFAVGPFDTLEGPALGATPLRLSAPRGRSADARAAADLGHQVLTRLEEVLGTPYPFTQLELLALPLAAGQSASAAPGLVTLAEHRLLTPAGGPDPAWQQAFLADAAPALARQWFGGLVSPAGWDDAWVADALAGWLGARVAGGLQGDAGGERALAQARARALQADRWPGARPLQRGVQQHDDFGDLADAASRDKGTTLIAMLEGWLGPDRLREVLRRVLERQAWGPLRSTDLADALGAADPALPEVLRGFSTQPGVPRIALAVKCTPGATPQLRVAQSRWQPLGLARGDGAAPTWRVPMVLRTPQARYRLMLDSPEATLTLPESGCPPWVQAHADGRGLYRVAQAPGALLALARAPGLPAPEALALADDARGLHASGDLDNTEALAIASALAAQPRAAAAEAAAELLAHLQPLAGTGARAATQAGRWQQLLGPRARALGWLPRPGEADDERLLRVRLLPLLATTGGDAALAEQARGLARGWLDGRQPLPGDLLGPVLAAAAPRGDAALFDGLAQRLRAGADAGERRTLWAALGRFEDPALADRARELLLDPAVDLREALAPLLQGQAMSVTQRGPALDFLGQYQRAFARRVGRDMPVHWPALWTGSCLEGDPPPLRRVLGPLLGGLRGGARALDQADAAWQHCAAWRAHHGPLP